RRREHRRMAAPLQGIHPARTQRELVQDLGRLPLAGPHSHAAGAWGGGAKKQPSRPRPTPPPSGPGAPRPPPARPPPGAAAPPRPALPHREADQTTNGANAMNQDKEAIADQLRAATPGDRPGVAGRFVAHLRGELDRLLGVVEEWAGSAGVAGRVDPAGPA